MTLTNHQIKKVKSALLGINERLPIVFSALGDPTRFRIFRILLQYHDICVTDIARLFGITVSAASQQLRFMELSGLIRKIRMGQMICYEIKGEDPVVQSIIKIFR